jgi:hypothetical protein
VSRFVDWGGKHWGREFFTHPAAADECPRCGGLGVIPTEIDGARYDVAVPCPKCRMYCKDCKRWVKPAGHTCVEAK